MRRNRTTNTRYVEELMAVEKRGKRIGEILQMHSDSKRDGESWRDTDGDRERWMRIYIIATARETRKAGETRMGTGRDGETRMGTGRDSDSKRDEESWRDTNGDRERWTWVYIIVSNVFNSNSVGRFSL